MSWRGHSIVTLSSLLDQEDGPAPKKRPTSSERGQKERRPRTEDRLFARWKSARRTVGQLMGMKVAQDVGLLKTVGQHQLFVPQERSRGTLGHHLPFIQQHCTVAELHDQLQVGGEKEVARAAGFIADLNCKDAFRGQLPAPSYRRHYVGWIMHAKQQETRERRLRETISLLEQNRKLGLK